MSLHRYWFRFAFSPQDRRPPGALVGCGVTAWSIEDARSMVRAKVFMGTDLPEVTELREDVDVATLDPGHVLPNMGVPSQRGVWFPLGYE